VVTTQFNPKDPLLLTGVSTSLRRLFAKIRVNERNGDFSPTIIPDYNPPVVSVPHAIDCRSAALQTTKQHQLMVAALLICRVSNIAQRWV